MVGTSPWEPSNTQKETSPMRKNWSQQLETSKWEPFFLPNALVVPYCHSLVSRNCIRYMEPSLYTRPRIWIRSLRSLSTLASLAIQILYPPRRVCADGESHPPARLVIASPALALTSPALPDSPAPRLQP